MPRNLRAPARRLLHSGRLPARRAPPRTASISTSSRQGPARQNRSWSGFTAAEIIDGETNDYDGSKLATGGPLGTPIVVVTINYRLGLFGFLSESHLNAEGHPWGNYGILDQQAALRWVQANIAAFGGDPSNVTLGGQSAGAIDTTANLISPAAAGLFQRAITQSAPIPNVFFQTAAVALSQGNTVRCCSLAVRAPRVCVSCRPHGSCSCREHPMQVLPTQMASRLWMEPSYPCYRKRPGPLGLTTICPSWEARPRTN